MKVRTGGPEPASFHGRVRELILRIPPGRVATYGQIALLAGNNQAARQVAWVLHSSSAKDKLPWQRVINSRGGISLKPGRGYELQRGLLEDEGVQFEATGRVDLKRYLWHPHIE